MVEYVEGAGVLLIQRLFLLQLALRVAGVLVWFALLLRIAASLCELVLI